MPVILLETSIRDELENWFDISLTVVTPVQGVIFEGFRYANNTTVVTSLNEESLQFENVIFRIKTPYLVCYKMETLGLNAHFNAYEVLEIEEPDLIRIVKLFDYQHWGCIQSEVLTVI